uniref:BAG domain-containing protein n=1 Tax=Panagrellus redivivus TaxID=6233 RepID=A0A7E4V447_PANRE
MAQMSNKRKDDDSNCARPLTVLSVRDLSADCFWLFTSRGAFDLAGAMADVPPNPRRSPTHGRDGEEPHRQPRRQLRRQRRHRSMGFDVGNTDDLLDFFILTTVTVVTMIVMTTTFFQFISTMESDDDVPSRERRPRRSQRDRREPRRRSRSRSPINQDSLIAEIRTETFALVDVVQEVIRELLKLIQRRGEVDQERVNQLQSLQARLTAFVHTL